MKSNVHIIVKNVMHLLFLNVKLVKIRKVIIEYLNPMKIICVLVNQDIKKLELIHLNVNLSVIILAK